MNPQRWERIKQIFDAALDRASEERSSFVQQACAGDGELSGAVERLLQQHARGDGFLDTPEPAPPNDSPHAPRSSPAPVPGGTVSGSRLGAYEIIETLGEGGMGTVYLARQERPRRLVALKVARPSGLGGTSAAMLRRFEHETHVLSLLQHPGIAQIHEAGTIEGDHGVQLFFAMELVRGPALTVYAEEQRLSVRERLELFIRVCDAVEHAHQKGVIHRDLKPANILVVCDDDREKRSTEQGDKGGSTPRPYPSHSVPLSHSAQPKVIDFGVAHVTQADLQLSTLHTQVGQLIGTVPYMSPEQAAGDPNELDTRSDVYALGVVLYELLAGRPPFDVAGKFIPEALRIVRESTPPRLCTVIGKDGRPARHLRGDLETIVAKAIEKEKPRRYQSVSELRADIEHFLRDEPILARPPSAVYQLRKFARRNRALVSGVAAVFVVLIAGVAATAWQAIRAANALHTAQTERTRALEREAETKKIAEFQAAMLTGIDAEQMGRGLAEDLLDEARASMQRRKMADDPIETQIGVLRESLRGVNATNVAIRILDSNILDRALKAIGEQFTDQPLLQGALLQTVSEAYHSLGRIDHAMAVQRRVLDIHRSNLGEEHPDTLTSISNIGFLLQEQGQLADAEGYLREALNKRRRILGEEHNDTLVSINTLGVLLSAQGKLEEAEPYYVEALDKRRRLLGDDNPETLRSINNMGVHCLRQGRIVEAERYFSEALERRRRLFGDEHPETLTSINCLGSVLRAQGRLAEAEPYLREALETRRRVLGDDHPRTLTSISNLGDLLEAQGKLGEAERYYVEALERFRRVLGDEHPNTLMLMCKMGHLRQVQGKLAEAESYNREALEARRRVQGDEHPDTLGSILVMNTLLQAQGKLAEAAEYSREALEKRRRMLGDEHPHTLASISDVGGLLFAQGKLTEAAPYFREALEKRRLVLGDEHSDTLWSIRGIGLLLQAQGKLAEAEVYYREAWETRRRLLGVEHRDTLESSYDLGGLLLAQGKLAEAADYFRSVLAICRSLKPEGDPDIATSSVLLADCLVRLEQFQEAETLLREALFILGNALPDEHPQVWRRYCTMSLLGETLSGQRRFAEAEPLLLDSYERIRNDPRVPAATTSIDRKGDALERIVNLYEAWHAAEPEQGYDGKAAEWRAKLETLRSKSSPE